MANLSICTVMTMGLLWAELMVVKSSSVKVLHGILNRPLVVIEWTDWMAQRCFFRVVLEYLPPENPLTIILTCSAVYLGFWFSREGLLQIFPYLRPMFLSGIELAIVLMSFWTSCLARSFLRGLSLRDRVLRTGFHSFFSSWQDVGHHQNDVILLVQAVCIALFNP